MAVTVIDVAKAAGVSRTTVSNVFNNRAKCSEETKKAVLAAAQKSQYKPNLAAKTLVTSQSNVIGLLLPSYVDKATLTNSPFYNIILDGIYFALRNEAYYDLMIFCIPPKGSWHEISAWIDVRNVDGIIAIGEYERSFLKDLDAKEIPFVLIDNYAQADFANFSQINSDDATGGYLAAKKLIAAGYERIGICTTTLKSPLNHKRYEGYQRALQEAGRQPAIFEKVHTSFEVGQYLGELAVQQQMDAVFCAEDMIAVGVLNALLRKGVQIGKEFGIVGFDNLNICQQVYPTLTTIDQNIFEKGQIAANTMLNILKHGALRRTRLLLPVQLVERESA